MTFDSTLVHELETVAHAAADAAASIHLAGIQSGYRSHAKGVHGDLVTDIDRRAEHSMIDVIRARRPDDTIVGEEHGVQGDGTVHWILDPIDGTANYVRGAEAFAVSVGVEIDGVPVVGVVHQTATETRWATHASSALRNGITVSVSTRDSLGEGVIATGFTVEPTHRSRQLRVFNTLMEEAAGIRRCGSPALDLCHVAEGSVDGFFEIGLGPWDYAAGRAIVAAAGGITRIIDVSPWRGPAVVSGPAPIVDQLVEVFERAGVPMPPATGRGPADP